LTSFERQRADERDKLQEALTRVLQDDARVDAAWLFGSFGRGDADVWSDLDVVIVVADDAFDEYLADRYTVVSKLGKVVLSFESSFNGPPGGCYLMTGYESATGLMLVDWYWQPHRAARMPNSKAVLVSRNPVEKYDNPDESLVTLWQAPGHEPPLPLWNPTDAEDRANCGVLAWAMLAILTKHVARKPDEPGLGFQEFIEKLVSRATYKSEDELRPGDPAQLTTWPDRLDRLEALAEKLRTPVAGGASPAESYGRFLATVRAHCVARN